MKKKRRDHNDKGWERKPKKCKGYVPIASISCSLLSSLLESETLFFMVGPSSESLRIYLDPSLEDRSASSLQVAELGMDKGVTTRE